MKIALVASPYALVRSGATGGAERVMLELARTLREGGHHVVCYAPWHVNLPPEIIGIPKLRLGKVYPYWYSAMALLRSRHIDYIVAFNCPWMSVIAPERAVFYAQNYGIHLPLLRFRFKNIVKSRYRRAVAVACSDSVADWLRDFIAFPGRIVVIYNGVDVNRFTPRSDCAPTKTVAFAGQWSRKKGLHVLLRAARRLATTSITVRIAGSTSLWGRNDHDQLIASEISASPKNVEFVGLVPHAEMHRFWQSADVAVLPSVEEFEGLPLSKLEAMACGLPVIASNLPGARDLIIHGYNGMLVSPEDPEQLAEAITFVLEDYSRLRKMSAAARDTALNYSLERQAIEFEKLLRSLN
jgi:glycosyltransferase involved in cell wall biosynthesis